MDALPFETLSSIFLHSSDYGVDCEAQRQTTSKIFLFLGHVCSRWRSVARKTPQLWTNIVVKCCNDLVEFDLMAARSYLSLCGPSLPLTLHVHWGEIEPQTAEDEDAFKALVIPHATRWKTIHIRLFIRDFGVELITKTIQCFTSLSELKFTLPTTCEPPQQYPKIAFIRFVKKCKEPISLASLLHLSLDCRSYKDPYASIVPILDHLVLPSLSKFTLLFNGEELHYKDQNDIWKTARAMLQRSHPPLKCIYTSLAASPDDALIPSILQHVPLLERADCLYVGPSTLPELAFVAPGFSNLNTLAIAPNLTEIFIYDCPEDVDSVVNMLSLRWLGGEGPLKRVVVLGATLNSTCLALADKVREELKGLEIVEKEWREQYYT